MGDRAVIQFKATDADPPINLYMHWGGHRRYSMLNDAIEAARGRWNDPDYATRICISQIIGADWNDPLGFGISVGDENSRLGDYNDVPCVVWDRRIVRVRTSPSSFTVLSFDNLVEKDDDMVLSTIR